MTTKTPPDASEFASFDDLPKRVKQPQWRWWKQPFGIALLGVLIGAIVLVAVLNKGRIILEQPVTLLADLSVADDSNPSIISYRGLNLTLEDLSLARNLPDLSAGDQACLQVKTRPFDELRRYNLRPLDEC